MWGSARGFLSISSYFWAFFSIVKERCCVDLSRSEVWASCKVERVTSLRSHRALAERWKRRPAFCALSPRCRPRLRSVKNKSELPLLDCQSSASSDAVKHNLNYSVLKNGFSFTSPAPTMGKKEIFTLFWPEWNTAQASLILTPFMHKWERAWKFRLLRHNRPFSRHKDSYLITLTIKNCKQIHLPTETKQFKLALA